MRIIVYSAIGEAPAGTRFVAYLFQGSAPMPIRFFASTAALAEERAAIWLREETERQAQPATLARNREERVRAKEATSGPVG